LFVYYLLLSSLPSYLHTIYWHCHILLLPPILLAWLAISISVIWQFIWPIRFLFIQSWHWQQKLTGKIKKNKNQTYINNIIILICINNLIFSKLTWRYMSTV
jgi:hypothetical protein